MILIQMLNWLIKFCLMSRRKYFMHIHVRALMSDNEWTLLCTLHTHYYTCRLKKATLWRKSCHFTQKHFSDSGQTSLCICCVLSREAANTNFNVFGLTRLEECAYHYTIEEVLIQIHSCYYDKMFFKIDHVKIKKEV